MDTQGEDKTSAPDGTGIPLVPVVVVLPFASADDLVAQYAACLTLGGIYLPIEPKPVRTMVRLEVRVQTGETVLVGTGTVSFVTAPGKRGHPGMGIRFLHLEAGQALVQRACENRETDPQLPPLPFGVEMAEGEAAAVLCAPAAAAPSPRPPETVVKPPEPEKKGPPLPRAPVHLAVAFPAGSDPSHAVAPEVMPAGLTLATKRPLPVGTQLEVQIRLATWQGPLSAKGEVTAVSAEAMTVRLPELKPEELKRFQQLASTSPTRSGKPFEPRISEVSVALLLLSDEMLTDVTAEMLGLKGVAAFDAAPEGLTPDVVAADAANLVAAAKAFPGVALVAVNLSGPDALAGGTTWIKPRSFVKKPAAGAGLTQAILSLLRQ